MNMLQLARCLSLAALLIGGLTAHAQTLVWEHVGDRAVQLRLPSIAPDGFMWAEGLGDMLRLSPPYGPTSVWETVDDGSFDQVVLTLGQDTVVTADRGPLRSVDNGASFQTAPIDFPMSFQALAEVPAGLPHGGTLLGGGRAGEIGAYSRDRGASWFRSVLVGVEGGTRTIEALAVVGAGPHAGRILGVGFWGLVFSDDGGQTYARVPGWWQHFRFRATHVAVLAGVAPGGGDRLVALINDPQRQPRAELLVVVSDDGGDSWREAAELRGDPNAAGEVTVDFGEGRAVIVMDGGHVWVSSDGGETWEIVGVVPGSFVDEPVGNGRTLWALKGPDGRIYVGGSRLGGSTPGWAFRTEVSFAVAGEASPATGERLGLQVFPNPTTSAATVAVRLAAPERVTVRVFDVQGREVAVVHDGAAIDGQRFAIETAGLAPGAYRVRITTASGARTSAGLTVAR